MCESLSKDPFLLSSDSDEFLRRLSGFIVYPPLSISVNGKAPLDLVDASSYDSRCASPWFFDNIYGPPFWAEIGTRQGALSYSADPE